MKNVLCVCFGNTCRSPMIEAVLQRKLGGGFMVQSAGVSRDAAGQPANKHSILCMKERGMDISGHFSYWVGDLVLSKFSHIVCVDDKIAGQVSELLKTQGVEGTIVIVLNAKNGGVPNPYQKGLTAYRNCLALLDRTLPQVATQIRGG